MGIPGFNEGVVGVVVVVVVEIVAIGDLVEVVVG